MSKLEFDAEGEDYLGVTHVALLVQFLLSWGMAVMFAGRFILQNR